MREWVAGFLMDEEARMVMLVRKRRPEWQAGMLNGIGGKIEDGETPSQAMRREFEEEAGVEVDTWEHFLTLQWEEGLVHFFRAFEPPYMLASCKTLTDEKIERHRIDEFALHPPVVPNLLWLVPLAAHRHDTYEPIHVVETATVTEKLGRQGGPHA